MLTLLTLEMSNWSSEMRRTCPWGAACSGRDLGRERRPEFYKARGAGVPNCWARRFQSDPISAQVEVTPRLQTNPLSLSLSTHTSFCVCVCVYKENNKSLLIWGCRVHSGNNTGKGRLSSLNWLLHQRQPCWLHRRPDVCRGWPRNNKSPQGCQCGFLLKKFFQRFRK